MAHARSAAGSKRAHPAWGIALHRRESHRSCHTVGEGRRAGIEGARLRLRAHADRREWEVTATLEVEGGRSFVCIARVDVWPPDPHKTVHRELCRRLGIPLEIESHHVHRFEDNALMGLEAFRNGMPLARPIEGDKMSFRCFMEIVCAEFHVTGLEEFPPPPTWGSLL